MSRTLLGSALLLFAFAVTPAPLRADDPGQPPLTTPVEPSPPSSPLPGTLSGGTLQLGNATSSTFSGVIANGPTTQGLTKTGGGTMVFTPAGNTYSGATTINSSALSIGSGGIDAAPGPVNNASNSYSGGTTISGGGLFLSAGEQDWSGDFSIDSGCGATYSLFGGFGGGMMTATAPRGPVTPIPKGPVFYIVTEGAGMGDSVRTVPCTGKETVLSGVGAVGGISQVSSGKIWIARPAGDKSTILNVDWDAIAKRGINATNYTLQPGDRLVFGEDPATTRTNLLSKKTSPVERTSGIISLATSTLRGVEETPGGVKLVKDLLATNLFSDSPHLKAFIENALRDAEQKKKPSAKKKDEPKTSEGTEKHSATIGTGTLELTVEQPAESPKAAEQPKNLTIKVSGPGAVVLLEEGLPKPSAASAPHELAMRPLPAYRIEPPDVLQIEMLKLVPLPPYRAGIFDVLQIRANAPPDKPIDQNYIVDGEGKVDLGSPYGPVKVAGMTRDEMKKALDKHLNQYLAGPNAYVQLTRMAGMQPVTGQYVVAPDGTINLRKYGQVLVSGKTVPEVKAAVENQLKKFLDAPDVSVNIISYNSKVYFVITQGAGLGDSVRRLPVTGNETVLDAISQIGGLSQISSKKNIFIVRPSASDAQKATILHVGWDAISRRGETATNYQIMPRDRVYIGEDRLLTTTNLLSKKTAPLERAMGIISLATSTVRSMEVTPGGAAAVQQLVEKGVFDDDPQVKQIVEEAIRVSDEAGKKAAKPESKGKPGR